METFCRYILQQYPLPGPWLGNSPLRLRRESYILRESTTVIYHWYNGCYWECTPVTRLDKRMSTQLAKPSTWVPTKTVFHTPLHTTARIRMTVHFPYPDFRLEVLPMVLPDKRRWPIGTSSLVINPEFAQYVTGLPPYLQQYLTFVQCINSPGYCAKKLAAITEDDQILMVSDGSSIEGLQMSFGGILGTSGGEVLARVHGIATGQATCVLAGALLITHLSNFCHTIFPSLTVLVCCNNQSVIKRLNDGSKYDKVYPNSTLQPEWDLIEEAVQQYREQNLKHFKFKWVRGHQDSLKDDNILLTVQAEYNIMADDLATSFVHDHNMPISHSATIQGAEIPLRKAKLIFLLKRP